MTRDEPGDSRSHGRVIEGRLRQIEREGTLDTRQEVMLKAVEPTKAPGLIPVNPSGFTPSAR